MRVNQSWITLAVAALLAPSFSAAAPQESLRLSAETAWTAASAALPKLGLSLPPGPRAVLAQEPAPSEPFFLDPKANPLMPFEAPGALVGKILLPTILDKHRNLMNRQLGASNWDISLAGDAGFKTYFFTFAQGDKLVIAPMGDPNRLRGDGVNVRIDPATAYNFKVSINIFDPIRGSTLNITPIEGTKGPKHGIKTGLVLDAIKAKSYAFKTGGKEYWLLHGTDVDPKTNRLTDTRSLLFINEAGMSSKAWPLAESQLEAGKPLAVDFNGKRLVLTRSAAGELSINEAR